MLDHEARRWLSDLVFLDLPLLYKHFFFVWNLVLLGWAMIGIYAPTLIGYRESYLHKNMKLLSVINIIRISTNSRLLYRVSTASLKQSSRLGY